MPNGQLKKMAFMAGAAYAVHKNVQKYAAHPLLAQMGAVDKSGDLDLDGLLASVKQAVPDTGVKIDVPILGSLTFYLEDFERLAAYIKEV